MKSYRLKIFCDFKITLSDSNSVLDPLKKFIPPDNTDKLIKIDEDHNNGNINTREFYAGFYDLVTEFTLEKLDVELNKIETENTFENFVSYCSENEHDLFIVSDIFDYYINKVFEKENIHVSIYSGKLNSVSTSGKLDIYYPDSDEYCRLCNTCKRNILICNTNDLDNEISVYIGDDISDGCVSGFADIVFAKGKLASYCWKNNITYFEYNNFTDIINKLSKPENKKFIKQRNEARVRRKDVLMGG